MPTEFAADAFKRAEAWSRLITNNKTARSSRRRRASRIRAMAQKRVEEFLRGKGQVMFLAGPAGSGKLYGAELAAKAAGFQATVLDRTQGSINYSLLGACALGEDGLTRTVTIVCGADYETTPPDPKTLPKGTKIILIANSCCQELKKAGIHMEKLNRPTQDAMCKTLFLDHDWPAVKAKRLSALADCDWRRLWTLDRLFTGAGVDVAEGSEDDFQQLFLNTAKDKNLLDDTPPSAAVHQLFSGHATKSNTVTDYAEHSVLMWAEANKDIVCSSIEQMADLQEAVVYTEMLTSGGEHDIGLDTFAMAAALNTNPNMRYDFTKYRNPWAARKETEESRAICESWQRRGSWQTRLKRRLTQAQESDTPAADRSETQQKAAKTKRAPTKAVRATTKKAARA